MQFFCFVYLVSCHPMSIAATEGWRVQLAENTKEGNHLWNAKKALHGITWESTEI